MFLLKENVDRYSPWRTRSFSLKSGADGDDGGSRSSLSPRLQRTAETAFDSSRWQDGQVWTELNDTLIYGAADDSFDESYRSRGSRGRDMTTTHSDSHNGSIGSGRGRVFGRGGRRRSSTESARTEESREVEGKQRQDAGLGPEECASTSSSLSTATKGPAKATAGRAEATSVTVTRDEVTPPTESPSVKRETVRWGRDRWDNHSVGWHPSGESQRSRIAGSGIDSGQNADQSVADTAGLNHNNSEKASVHCHDDGTGTERDPVEERDSGGDDDITSSPIPTPTASPTASRRRDRLQGDHAYSAPTGDESDRRRSRVDGECEELNDRGSLSVNQATYVRRSKRWSGSTSTVPRAATEEATDSRGLGRMRREVRLLFPKGF